MAVNQNSRIEITAYDWVPDFAKGLVRDLRVRWALEEAGEDYRVRYLSQGDQKQPPHRALQPFGQVPTYEEGGLTLFESGAIVLHIAQTKDGLLPEGADGKARAAEWIFAALNTVEVPISDLALVNIFEADESWSATRRPAVIKRVEERLDELAARLGEAEWLDGAFSAGDLMMISVLRQLRGSGLIEQRKTLADYVARGEARPAFKRAYKDHMAGFTREAPPEFA